MLLHGLRAEEVCALNLEDYDGRIGRLLNEKCWTCSLLTPAEARKLHDETLGGGCWQEEFCHCWRSYYRKGRGSRVQRSPQIEEIVVPIPEIF